MTRGKPPLTTQAAARLGPIFDALTGRVVRRERAVLLFLTVLGAPLMAAWDDRMTWRRRTCCVYCGARISGELPPHRYHGAQSYRRALRRAATVACSQHIGLALDEQSVERSVGTVDEPAGDEAA